MDNPTPYVLIPTAQLQAMDEQNKLLQRLLREARLETAQVTERYELLKKETLRDVEWVQ